MATFDQRDSGNWQAIIRRKGFPNQSKTFPTKGEAERWARQIEASMDTGKFQSISEAEELTFADLAKRFREEFAPTHYKSSAWQFKLEKLIDRLKDYALSNITTRVVEHYIRIRSQDPDSRYKTDSASTPRVSGATVKTEVDLLSKIFEVAIHKFKIHLPLGNPTVGATKPKSSPSRDRRLTDTEREALMRECAKSRNPWLLTVVKLAVETGVRRKELLEIERKNIHTTRRVAVVEASKQKLGKAEHRAIPLSRRAVTALEELPESKSDLAIPQAPGTVYKAFKNACARAKIEDYTYHDLRHEALSRMGEKGTLSVLEIASISGHKNLQTLKKYVHFQAEKLATKLD